MWLPGIVLPQVIISLPVMSIRLHVIDFEQLRMYMGETEHLITSPAASTAWHHFIPQRTQEEEPSYSIRVQKKASYSDASFPSIEAF